MVAIHANALNIAKLESVTGNLEDMPLKTFFQQWKPSISEEDMKKLTHEGEEEMLQLAKRMKNRFPTLFPVVFSNSSYQVNRCNVLTFALFSHDRSCLNFCSF